MLAGSYSRSPHRAVPSLSARSARARIRSRIFGLLVCGALATTGVDAFAQETDRAQGPQARTATLMGLQDTFASIADALEPAVVTIVTSKSARVPGEEGLRGVAPFRNGPHRFVGTGSGVVISPDGWVLTNDHVVGGADRVTVRMHDGREFAGAVRRDYRSDLALVKIATPTPLPAAKLGDSDAVRIGHWAIAIGSPYRYEGSFSVGVISSLYRQQTIEDFGAPQNGRFYPNMIQTDAAINPGNSGGPLCNINGEVIGINTAIESDNGGSVGIGFAIPINTAKFVIAQLRERGRVSYGYLGVNPTSVTPRYADALKVDQGALIVEDPGDDTPAAKSGLRAGDVVTSFDGRPVKNDLDLRTAISHSAPGTTVTIGYVRDGQEKTAKAVLGQVPEVRAEQPRVPAAPRLGIDVTPITKRQEDQYGLPPGTRGVIIRYVDQASSAADVADLVEGTVIQRINGTDVTDVPSFTFATAKLKSGDEVRLFCLVKDRAAGKFVRRFDIVTVD